MKATVIKVASTTLAFAALVGAASTKRSSKGAKGNPTQHATMGPYPGYDGPSRYLKISFMTWSYFTYK